MKNYLTVLLIVTGVFCLATTTAAPVIGIHIEDFSTPIYPSGDWMKFSVDHPLDYKEETPHVTITSAYDWTHGGTAVGGNPNSDGENLMVAGVVNRPGAVNANEYYLDAGGNGEVRWVSVDLLGYGDSEYGDSSTPVYISIIGGDSSLLWGPTAYTPANETLVHIDFGDLPWDPGVSTLRIEDQTTSQPRSLIGGYMAFDNLVWSEQYDPSPYMINTHVETFTGEPWNVDKNAVIPLSEGWLDNAAETPCILVRSAWDTEHGIPTQGDWGNLNWPEGDYPVLMLSGDPAWVPGLGTTSWEEFYLTIEPACEPEVVGLRFNSVALICYGGTDGSIVVTVKDSTDTEVYNSGEIWSGEWGDANVPLDFGDLALDPVGMTLRIEDWAPDASHAIRNGYWAIDNLSWSSKTPVICGMMGTPGLQGDADDNCYVNMDDLKFVAQYWTDTDDPQASPTNWTENMPILMVSGVSQGYELISYDELHLTPETASGASARWDSMDIIPDPTYNGAGIKVIIKDNGGSEIYSQSIPNLATEITHLDFTHLAFQGEPDGMTLRWEDIDPLEEQKLAWGYILVDNLTFSQTGGAGAGTHTETFDGANWASGDWMQHTVDGPLDNMTETPDLIVRSAYDYVHGAVRAFYCGDGGSRSMAADLTQDCYVRLDDFALVAKTWLDCDNPEDILCN